MIDRACLDNLKQSKLVNNISGGILTVLFKTRKFKTQ